jgi:hypothetical protein
LKASFFGIDEAHQQDDQKDTHLDEAEESQLAGSYGPGYIMMTSTSKRMNRTATT